jgi:hypothetical protein
MELREIKDEERPLCPQCKKPLIWMRSDTYYHEVYGWDYDCECVDTARLKPDHIFRFTP